MSAPARARCAGLELAELSALPPEIVESARQVAQDVRARLERERLGPDSTERRRALSTLAHRLLYLLERETFMGRERLSRALTVLQTKFNDLPAEQLPAEQ